ncbi:MAG: hypothetical protein ACJAT7_000376 [Psychromonas sp.]|jgi:hypothetical protein|uniref:hypothetical protein n=1 Tax=Psychromonas sp. TaxID=1884585 RepID=UPI0039E437AC
MLKKGRVIQLGLMLLVLLALVLWRTFDSVQAVAPKNQSEAELVNCDYFTPCEFTTPQGAFWLTVANPPIKAEQWIDFNLQSELQTWRIIDAKIIGKNMFMGRIPVLFSPFEKGFAAKTLVGACTSKQMIWQLQITAEVNDISELLLFDFVVTH